WRRDHALGAGGVQGAAPKRSDPRERAGIGGEHCLPPAITSRAIGSPGIERAIASRVCAAYMKRPTKQMRKIKGRGKIGRKSATAANRRPVAIPSRSAPHVHHLRRGRRPLCIGHYGWFPALFLLWLD